MPLYGPLAFLIKAWHASPSWFARPEQCLLGPIQWPSPTAKARAASGRPTCLSLPTSVQHLVFLPVSISSLTSQSKEHFVHHGHQAACRTMLSSARSRKSLFPVLHCLSKPVNVKPWRRYNLPYTNRSPTSRNAAHLTTFFILISAPCSQPCSLKPNSLLVPRVSLL